MKQQRRHIRDHSFQLNQETACKANIFWLKTSNVCFIKFKNNHVSTQGCECPLHGSIQGQAGWGFEQPDLEGGIPAYSRVLELGDLKGSFQPKPFHDSIL